MTKKTGIGIVAPSSKVPRIELKLGVERIRQEGFTVDVHPQCNKSHLFFAGDDEERAEAFFEYAKNSKYSSLWCARGGHGSIRLLPLLEKLAIHRGAPGKKLLIGYSDATALMEYVRKAWGWSTLHAPMPSMRQFSILGDPDWKAMMNWIQGEQATIPWADKKLTFWAQPPKSPILAPMVGGNLTVWSCLLGTRFQPKADGYILFLEDIDESLYRLDRTLQQLVISGSLDRVQAIVLGNFMNCKDYSPSVLKSAPTEKNKIKTLKSPKPSQLEPLRKVMNEKKALREIFEEVGDKLKIPVAFGLPVGHGPEVSPLPLGAVYRLTPQGKLELVSWNWLRASSR